MSNPQSNIPGRTPLSEAQKVLIQQLDAHHVSMMRALERLKPHADVDQRALSLAITNAEQSHMWAVRSVAKPKF